MTVENLELVRENGRMLRCIVDKTYDVCLEAVGQNGMALEYVPEEYKDIVMCQVAVNRNGCALMYVPEELRTYKMSLDAVRQNGFAIEYVNVGYEKLYQRLCLEAVKNNGCSLKYVSYMVNNEANSEMYNICLEAVRNNGFAIIDVGKYLHFDKREYEMFCLEAIKQNVRVRDYLDVLFRYKQD
jgi:hypothetical protein